MQKIVFVTGNAGKAQSLARRLDTARYTIVQKALDIPEVQAANAREIALFKAHHAYEQVGEPVVVHDSSFHVHALGGFPGPYVKYVNETLGVEGVLKLLDGAKDRSCHFEATLVYMDTNGAKAFTYHTRPGTIALKAQGNDKEHAWSGLWRIYVPSGHDKPLALFTSEEFKRMEAAATEESEFTQFINWLDGSTTPR